VSVYGPYPGTVAGVHDGDTVNVNLENDEDVGFDLHLIARIYTRVRVKGINAPELSTVEGKSARDFAQTLLPPGAPVRVTSHGWDKFGGRIDGDIEFKTVGIFVSFADTMVNAGHAVPWDGTGPKPS
jgi:endonuclease YncB( thermonuclease family)